MSSPVLQVVHGRFLAVGGPSPGVSLRLGGEITATRAAGYATRTTASDGTFTLSLPSGRYTLSGRSGQIGAGASDCPGPTVVIGEGPPASADVVCNLA